MVKRLLYLFAVFGASILIQLVIWSIGELFTGIALLLMLFIVLMPLVSFFYSKKFISKNTKKRLKSLVCPLVLAMSYLVLYLREDETYVFALVLLIWCEIWSLIGLKAKKSDTANIFKKALSTKITKETKTD